jgi:phosphinothricin acetyltransferase
MGVKHLLANISSRNKQSIGFHLKNGFTECGRFHNIGRKKGDYFDVVWMEKEIK